MDSPISDGYDCAGSIFAISVCLTFTYDCPVPCAQSVIDGTRHNLTFQYYSRTMHEENSQKPLIERWLHLPDSRLKIRRYLVPWGFNSPSRHQHQSREGRWSPACGRK